MAWRTFQREGARPSGAAVALAAVAALAAYYNSFRGPFIFDDLPSIVENPTVRNLADLPRVLAPNQGGLTTSGRPLVNLSVAVNFAIGKTNPVGYHVMNLAIHVAAGLVLMAVVRRTLLLPRLAPRMGRLASPLALAVTLLWLVHPIQTEAVTYVIQRAESIVTLFYLLTIYCTIRMAGSREPERWCLAAACCCAAGMASKEVMVSAPLLVLLYDRAFLAGSFRQALRWRRQLYLLLAATWVVLGYLMWSTRERGGTAGFGIAVTWWEYARTQFEIVLHYLRLVFWPTPLVLDYGWPVAAAGQVVVPAIVIALLLAAAVWALVRRPMWGVPAALFFMALAPTSSIVPIKDLAFEHRMYLPLAGVIVLLVVGAYLLAETLLRRLGAGPSALEKLPTALGAAVLALTVLLAWRTSVRNADYQSVLSIWRDTAVKRPLNPRAQYSTAAAYSDLAKPLGTLAKQLFMRAQVLEKEGRADEGRLCRQQAGEAIAQAGEYAHQAELYNLKALNLTPGDVDARLNLGTTYLLRAMLREVAGKEATPEQRSDSYRLTRRALEEFKKVPAGNKQAQLMIDLCRKRMAQAEDDLKAFPGASGPQ